MKKILFFAVAVMLFASCSKEDVKPDYSNMKARIKAATPTLKAGELSPSEVVVQAASVMWDERYVGTAQKSEDMTEIIIPTIYILTSENKLDNMFIAGKDLIIRNNKQEVIAYVPNSTMRVAEPLIRNSFNNGKLDSCIYYLANKYKFIPITDAAWKELKKQGLN